jgi:hypothetical protein
MTIWKFLNNRRLRDYPRLIFFTSWSILLLNVLLHNGWIGGITGIMIGGDFISNYSGGNLYLTNITHLYDPSAQQTNQTSLIAPSTSPGFAPFISPPYVALAASWLQSIPLPYAFIAWEVLNFVCILISAYLLSKFILPSWLQYKDLSSFRISIIILSSLATVIGFLAGQSHGIILLLVTGIILAMIREKWIVAGILGCLLIYKPQFILGFLICWLVWGCFKSLISFGILALLWQVPILVSHGLSPYFEYLNFSKLLLYLPYAKDSFPISIMATPYALLATLFPIGYAKVLQAVIITLGILAIAFLVFVAVKAKNGTVEKRYFPISMAVILPLVIAPHTLIYDLLILVPAFALLVTINDLTEIIRLSTIILYLSLLFLPLIGYVSKLALPGIVPLMLYCYLAIFYFRSIRIAELS